MRFGTFSYNQARPWVPERQAFEELVEQVLLTEKLGFDERFAYFPGGLTVKRLDEWGTSPIGSPGTVIKKAREMIATAKPDSPVGMFSFGLSHEQVRRSIDLFATKVMLALGN